MKNLFFLVLVIIGLHGCSPTMSAVWQKEDYQPRAYKKVAVIAISKSLEARQNLEQNIIADLKEAYPEIKYISGLSLFPPNTTKEDWTKEKVEAMLKESNIDGVLTSSLINSYISSRYVSSPNVYYPRYYQVGGYIYGTYDYLYSPDYYENSQNYVIQSSIFDLREGVDQASAMVWRGESKVTDPSSIGGGASSYANNLVKYIAQKKLLGNNPK